MRKPRGKKYHHLESHYGKIRFRKMTNGVAVLHVFETKDWDEAADLRDEIMLQTDTAPRAGGIPFTTAADRYLAESAHLSASTLEDRRGLLGTRKDKRTGERRDGLVRSFFADMDVDQITRGTVFGFWTEEVEGRGVSPKTGRNYLDALSGVLGWAFDHEHIDHNPVPDFRQTLRRRLRTAKGRADTERTAEAINPIEDVVVLRKLISASEARGGPEHACTMLLLDAGLRLGEATALTWGDVDFGNEEDADSRYLTVHASLSRGRHSGSTKSGRAREVALSRRLRRVLLELHMEEGRPDPTESIAPLDHANFRNRHFKPCAKAAGLRVAGDKSAAPGTHSPKSLRDTYASWLLSVGIGLAYVRDQLGHQSSAITEKHYAKWIHGRSYREPIRLLPGECPADLLARISDDELHAADADFAR